MKYRVRNEIGPGPFSNMALIIAAKLPKAVNATTVQQVGDTLKVYWNNSFEDYGFPMTSYSIVIIDYYGYV